MSFSSIVREENEKLNVWIASLNLECLYGTDETLQNVFSEAVKRNEPKKVYLKTTDIYIRNGKLEVKCYVFHQFSSLSVQEIILV